MTLVHALALLPLIVALDLLLSGDNAVVVALVCRGLPEKQRNLGMVLGTAGAVIARIAMSLVASLLVVTPGLRLLGGVLLLYVAIGMLHDEETEEREGATTLLRAVVLVALADASMSLDNVMALAGVSNGNFWLMAVGVTLSIPFVIAGAKIISKIVDRFPILVCAGAGLLGWVAGGLIVTDPWIHNNFTWTQTDIVYYGFTTISADFVLIVGWIMSKVNQ